MEKMNDIMIEGHKKALNKWREIFFGHGWEESIS